jgi:LuxR family maltose regulon positive regulatory protein
MAQADPLIRTKLRPPLTRPGLIARPRLSEQVARGLRGPLTLVTAPAGSGKTTLVAACIADQDRRVAWLTLDSHDNRDGRFLSYLVAALQEADRAIGTEAARLLASAQYVSPEVILTSLVNDLDGAGGETVLVLDNYQFAASPAIHESVAFLLEHCPQTCHLVIATRSEPPLPLARLRARGQVVELRAADLAFTEAEARQFLDEVMGCQLGPQAVAALDERTEGWIAGLQMAALSMRGRTDVPGFIERFSGTNRFILDYLMEEVLAGQPPGIQGFLLRTSILERLTAPLCDALMADDEPPSPDSASAILAYLERANLFLVPLDDERIWFRYHHLFADLLRARLDHLHPGLAQRLHLRAAAWLRDQGSLVEAVDHALAAGEYDLAARLVEANTARLLAEGQLNALMGWVEALPAQVRRERPWLCIHQAYALRLAGRPAEATELLSLAESALDPETSPEAISGRTALTPRDPGEARAMAGAVAAVRAFCIVTSGQTAEAIQLAHRARELLPPEDLWNRASAAWALGFALHMQGHLAEAVTVFEEVLRLGRAMGNLWMLVTGLTDLARVRRDQGLLHQARALLEEALEVVGPSGARYLGFLARTEAHLAVVLYEQNQLDAAWRTTEDALAHARLWANPNYLAMVRLCQSRILLAHGDLQGARAAIGEADKIRRRGVLTRWIEYSVESELIRVWLAFRAAGTRPRSGDGLEEECRALLTAWRGELTRSAGKGPLTDGWTAVASLALARVAIAHGRGEEALACLEPLTHRAHAAGYVDVEVECLLLRALARLTGAQGQAQAALALADLEKALRLSSLGGYVLAFLSEGPPMQALLAQWLAQAGPSSLPDYAAWLLTQFDAEPAPSPNASDGGLVEPLSQRELEVLHLMALGRTNEQIGRQLFIARGTVKAHAASIYGKLGVNNRTEAVAQARELGIIP